MTEFLDPLSQAAAANSDESDDEIPRKETELAEKQEITEVDDGDLFDEEGKTEQQELDDDDIIDLVNDGSLAKIKNESMSNNRSLSTEFDDQKDLFVTVEKPEKIILSMETRPEEVRRRYQDFIWLRGKLEEAHPTHLIPPLPSKFIVKGMVDRFSSEFVGTRCRALDSFLKRIAKHPVISFSDHVTVFLTSEMPDKMRRRKFFTPAGMHVMSSNIRRCNQLTRVCLFNSNLNAELVHILKSNLEGSCLKIKLLNLDTNKVSKLRDEGLSTISEIVHQCQVEALEMKYCDFNKDQLERFKALIADTRVEFIV
uniref:sorting nexin-4-like n=1 Tax=Styela clava TaxID=7725 RepID=UPI001939B7B7|nr:sorting nexin-4-like [Styela clava]